MIAVMPDKAVDVLIVGAGPVGLSLAIECARHGARARVVEKLAESSGKSKALALWSSALESLAGMGCVEAFTDAAIPVQAMRIQSDGKELASVEPSHGIDSPYPQPILLPQSRTESLLTEHLISLEGKVERGVELVKFSAAPNGVTSTLRDRDGREEIVTSRWLAGCDGAHSAVRHGLDIDFHGYQIEETFALCDACIEGADLVPGEVVLDWSAKGILAIFPVVPGLWRVIANRRGSEWSEGDPSIEEMHAHLANHGYKDWKLSDPQWLAAFRIHERKVESFRQGPVMLVGDAAHIHSPAGGQGMNTGIQDAANLGWKLGLLARGRGDGEALLASYHAERSPVADLVLKEAASRTKISLLKNPLARFVRNTAVRVAGVTEGFQESMAHDLSGLGITYGESPILDTDGSWHEDWRSHGFPPGTRFRDVKVYSETEGRTLSLFALLSGGPHSLLLFSGPKARREDRDALDEYEALAIKLAGDSVRCVRIWRGGESPSDGDWLLDSDGSAHLAFAMEWCGATMVRPDGYVAFRCAPLDPELLTGYAALTLAKPGMIA